MLHISCTCSVQTDTFIDQIVGCPYFVHSQSEGTVLLPGVHYAVEVLQLCFEHIRFLSQNSLLFSLDLLEEEVTRFGLLSQ